MAWFEGDPPTTIRVGQDLFDELATNLKRGDPPAFGGIRLIANPYIPRNMALFYDAAGNLVGTYTQEERA